MEGKAEAEQQDHGSVAAAEKDVRFWSNKVQDLTEKLEKWWEDNPDSTGEEQRYQFLERSLTKANESLNEANERLDKARAYHLQLLAAQKSSEQTVGHKRIPENKWFKENMITKKLKVNQDERKDAEESVEYYETKYFEMSDFPPMAHMAPAHKKIIERKCYVVIFEQLIETAKDIFKEDSQANLVVTGNPGIGKSRFYIYCIYRLIRDQVLVKELPGVQLVINFGAKYDKYCFTSKQFIRLNKAEIDALQEEKKVIRLVEAKSSLLTGWRGVSILFSSPGLKEINDFIKVDAIKFIVPVWSLEELLEYNLLLDGGLKLSDEVLNARYDKYGGIPRFIFTKQMNEGVNDTELEGAITKFSSLDIINFTTTNKIEREENYSHRVLQMVPERSDFQNYFRLDFLSKYIAEQVIEKLEEDSLQKISEFTIAHWNDTSGTTAVLWGNIYEMMCHRQFNLPKKLKLNFRSLCTATSIPDLIIPENLMIVRFRKLKKIKVNEIPEDSLVYYRPTSRVFGALDAFIMDTINRKCYGLQMTKNKEHGIAAEPMKTFLEWLGNSFEFYYVFVVPNDVAEQFEEQKFKNKDGSVCKNPSKKLTEMAQFVAPFDPFSHRKK